MYKVIATDTYQKEIDRWTKADKEIAEKLPNKLSINPLIGKPLSYPFLREKRIREKRVYYLIYHDLNLVLLVATSSKKDQKETIAYIKRYLTDFRILAESISKQFS